MLVKIVVIVIISAASLAEYVPFNKVNYDAPIYERVLDDGYGYDYRPDSYGYGNDYEAHGYPKYKFSYGVHDPHTGDHKSQHEERDGDVVKGYYTVADPDGTLRTVHYTADDHNGFNAVVHRDGHSVHPEPILQKVYIEPKVLVEPMYEKVVYDKPIYEKPLYDYGYNDGNKYGHGYY